MDVHGTNLVRTLFTVGLSRAEIAILQPTWCPCGRRLTTVGCMPSCLTRSQLDSERQGANASRLSLLEMTLSSLSPTLTAFSKFVSILTGLVRRVGEAAMGAP